MTTAAKKSGGCGILGGVCYLTTLTIKLSVLVGVVALLVTVHNMRNEAAETALLLEKAQLAASDATQQKQAATASYSETQTQINKLQTDLANSRSELQKVQVELSKKQELQKEIDRKTQEAASAKQEVLVLTQKMQEVEAESRKQQVQGDQQLKKQLETLQAEKSSLQQKVEQQTAEMAAAAENLNNLKEEMKSTGMKYVQAEKQREMLSAKEKAQDRAIEELRATVKKLEAENKELHDLAKTQLNQLKDSAFSKHDVEKELTKAHEINAHVNSLWEQSKKELLEMTKIKEDSEGRLTGALEQNAGEQSSMANEANAIKQEYENRLNQAIQLKEQVKNQLEVTLQQKTELEEKLGEAEKLYLEKENMLSETSRVQQEAQKQVKVVKQQQQQAENQIKELHHKLKTSGSSDTTTLNHRIQRLESQLNKATGDYKKLEASSKEKIETLETKLNKTRDDWIASTTWGETIKDMAERREGELINKEKELETLTNEYENQEMEFEEMKNEVHSLVKHCTEKITTCETIVKELEEKRRIAKGSWLECDVQLQELQQKQVQTEKEIAAAEKKFADLMEESRTVVEHYRDTVTTAEEDAKHFEEKRRILKANWLECDAELQATTVQLQELQQKQVQAQQEAVAAEGQ